MIQYVRGVNHQCCMLHQSLLDGCGLLGQAMLQGGTAATEEPCEERQPSNPIYRCRQCGALFAGLQWTELSSNYNNCNALPYSAVVGLNEAEFNSYFGVCFAVVQVITVLTFKQ